MYMIKIIINFAANNKVSEDKIMNNFIYFQMFTSPIFDIPDFYLIKHR